MPADKKKYKVTGQGFYIRSSSKMIVLLQEIYKNKISYLFIAPSILVFTIFFLIPIAVSLYLSFTEYNVFQSPRWIGLQNFKEIFNDSLFWKALVNTIVYMAITVPLGVIISLSISIILNAKVKLNGLFRTTFLLPTVTSIVALSIIWKWLYRGGKYGLINAVLMQFGIQSVEWLFDPRFTLPAIMVMSIWAGLGTNIILFTAGLQTIPRAMYEAADIDGANRWSKLFYLTIPMLKPTLIYVCITSIIYAIQVFEQVFIMTAETGTVGGILNSALTLVMYLYYKGFTRYQMGYASALAYIIFFIILVISLINIKFFNAKEEYK